MTAIFIFWDMCLAKTFAIDVKNSLPKCQGIFLIPPRKRYGVVWYIP
jgi:hypothetical protein